MVNGLDLFKEHFKDHRDSFVIIGGTACYLLLDNAGFQPRATNDIDMILYIEVIKKDFGATFWEFLNQGGYETWQKSPGQKSFFRFINPKDKNYPQKIELLSSMPEGFDLPEGSRFTPIPFEDDISSLSAILMDGDYYAFVKAGHQILDELPILGAEQLIPLKAKAFLDLSQKKAKGQEVVHSVNIKKHKNDIFRLYPLLTETTRVQLPPSISTDLNEFITMVTLEPPDLARLGIGNVNFADVLRRLKTIYGL